MNHVKEPHYRASVPSESVTPVVLMARSLFHVTGINHSSEQNRGVFDTFYIMLIMSDNVRERGACMHSSQSVRCMRRDRTECQAGRQTPHSAFCRSFADPDTSI